VELHFKKGATKNTLLCQRKDGSSSWTQIDRFFIMHDLAHFCVESELGIKDGFYGLISKGVDISDFQNKEKIRAFELPEESILAELIVGLILTERSDNNPVPDFNKTLKVMATIKGIDINQEISDEHLENIRRNLDGLIYQWTVLPSGQELTLSFKE
jgi:hypothetical protein